MVGCLTAISKLQVWFLTPDKEVASGYVLEQDLVNEMYSD